ncbi:unnamed protein product [Dovyalis caffra]|uniref:K-box domain-containing protein n=1 Tax=Dovyalis caffra TaxID=77055 RepID=A0AAV1SR23_9ROSI|nr:unnamed protein product [Dovyalis caffra]
MFGQPSLELQLDGAVHDMLNKEIAERTRELRHMRGEDLQGLNIEELQKLEKSIEGSLCRVLEIKVCAACHLNSGDRPRTFAQARAVIRFHGDQYQQHELLCFSDIGVGYK